MSTGDTCFPAPLASLLTHEEGSFQVLLVAKKCKDRTQSSAHPENVSMKVEEEQFYCGVTVAPERDVHHRQSAKRFQRQKAM